MANVISDEILKLKIVVNGDEAQKRVLDLEKANQTLATRLKELIIQEKELDKQRKAEEKILKSNTEKLGKYNEKLTQTVISTAEEVRALRKKQEAYQQGSKEYERFEKQIEKLKERAEEASQAINHEIDELSKQQVQFEKNLSTATNAYNKLKREINDTRDAIADNKGKIDDEVNSMNIMNMTLEQLTRKAQDLKDAMKNMTEGESMDKTREELQAINDRISELRDGPDEAPGFLDQFNEYIGVIAAAIASVAGFLMKLQEVVDLNNALVDAQTAVAKTTGMTTDEVKELTAAYEEFDTRTSKMDLLKIAEVGGRLGVPKAEIQDFTREVDKAYVALGDSFSGGVEKVAEKIGKIKGLFKETKDLGIAQAINQIGSGLNELGASGAASEENMADFALRVGQLPESLKPTVAETLALGGAFEESGIDAERASSGYSAFVRTAAKEAASFAKVMHMSQAEVEKLINQDPMQFFLKFSEGAKGLDPVKLAQILDGLKLNSNEVISIIGAASENTDKFRASIEASNVAVSDATSLQQEFDKVNNNAAAIYDKVKKKWNDIYTSEKVAKVLAWIIDIIGKLLGTVQDTTGMVTIFRESLIFLIKILTIATVSMISYNAALALSELTLAKIKERLLAYSLIQKAHNLYTQASTTMQNIWNATIGYTQLALGRLTGSTNLQTAAQERLNLVTAANPWAAAVAVIMAVVTAYMLFSDASDDAAESANKLTKAQEFQNEMSKRINDEEAKSAAELKSKIEPLIQVIRDKNSALADRKTAYEELIKIAPEFKGTLDKEYNATIKLDEAYAGLIEKIKAAGRVRALQALLDEQYAKREKLAGKQEIFKNTQDKNKTDRSMRNPDGSDKAGIKFVDDLVVKTDQDLKELDGNIDTIVKKIADLKANKPDESNYTPLPEKEKKKKKTDAEKEAEKREREYKRMRDKILDDQESYDQKELEMEAQKQSALSEAQADGYEKERNVIIAERDKRLAELEKQRYKKSDFDDIDKIIAKEKGDLQQRFITIKNQWLKDNKLLDDTIEAEKTKSNYKLLTLDEKFATESLKKEEEAMQERVNMITREQNKVISQNTTVAQQKEFLKSKGFSDDTLQLIENWEQGKAAIEKYYQKQSLEEQVNFLQEQLAIFETVAATAPDLLSEDELETIQKYKDKIASLVAEIAKLKKGDEQKLGGKLASFGGGNGDLFGLTQDQWKAMFSNTDNLAEKIQKVGAAVQIAQNMFSAYSNFVQAREQKMLAQMEAASDRKKRKLKTQLDSGLITQENYKKETELIDADLDKKKAETEYKAAKRQRALQLAQAVSGVAMMVINAAQTNPFFPLGLVMTGVAAAMGAVQIATILNTPLPQAPGAEDGFYPVLRSQDNKMFNARRRRSKTGVYNEPTMLVGEGGATMPELVVSGKTMRRIDPEIQRVYMNEIRRVEGFEDGLYPKGPTSSGSDELLIRALELIHENTEVMKDIRKYGVKGVFEKSARVGKDITDMTSEYQDLINKNKH